MFLTLKLLGNRHPSFIARTVFVKNNNVEDACRLINRVLGKDGILEQYRLTRYYEKPFQVNIAFFILLSKSLMDFTKPRTHYNSIEKQFIFLVATVVSY